MRNNEVEFLSSVHLKRTIFHLKLTILIILIYVPQSSGKMPDNLTAYMVTTQFGKKSFARLCVKGDKVRIQVIGGRRFSTVIARYDKNVLWLLYPGAQKYMTMSIDAMDRKVPHFFRPDLKIKKTKVLEETINGMKAIKYKAEIIGGNKYTYKGYIWETANLSGFPIKWEDTMRGIVVEWRNIRDKEILDSMFELPEGYTDIDKAIITTPAVLKHQSMHYQRKEKADGTNSP